MNLFGNGRGLGVTDALHSGAEWPVVVLFALVTQLGDGWFLFVLAGGLYVAGDQLPHSGVDRRRGAFVFGVVVTYVALIGLLKSIFQLPRPPGAAMPVTVPWVPSLVTVVFERSTTASGPGFPSGHALGSTMVWGSLALVFRWRSVRTRVGAVGVLVALVSVSRLVLGVHYAVDVVVGAGLGVPVLWALYRFADRGRDPGRVFLVALVVGTVGLAVGITFGSVAAVGGGLGGWAAWHWVADAVPAQPATEREVLAGVAFLGVVAGLFSALSVVAPSLPVTFFGTALAVGGVVATPILAERVA